MTRSTSITREPQYTKTDQLHLAYLLLLVRDHTAFDRIILRWGESTQKSKIESERNYFTLGV